MPATLSFICSGRLKSSVMGGKSRYPECDSCINREFDPFQCAECKNGSNYEGEDDSEKLSYHEFLDLMKESA